MKTIVCDRFSVWNGNVFTSRYEVSRLIRYNCFIVDNHTVTIFSNKNIINIVHFNKYDITDNLALHFGKEY